MRYYTRLLPFLTPHRGSMVAAALLIMAVAAINLLLLRLAGRLWDVITVDRDLGQLTRMIGVFLVMVAVQGACLMGQPYLLARTSQRILAGFRTTLFGHLQSLSLPFFTKRRTGELLSRLM